jgi:hypothetical protein
VAPFVFALECGRDRWYGPPIAIRNGPLILRNTRRRPIVVFSVLKYSF